MKIDKRPIEEKMKDPDWVYELELCDEELEETHGHYHYSEDFEDEPDASIKAVMRKGVVSNVVSELTEVLEDELLEGYD